MARRLMMVTPDPHATVSTFHRWPPSAQTATPAEIFFREGCFRDAYEHVLQGCLEAEGGKQRERRLEIKGALLGVPARIPGQHRLQIWIHEAIPLPVLDADGPTYCVYRAEDKVKIDLLCERQYQGMQVVGWFHSHPKLGVFFSDVDKETMERAFPLAHHVGLVIDPVVDSAAFFVWEEGRIDQTARERFRPSEILGIQPPARVEEM